MELETIVKLTNILKESGLTELTFKSGDDQVTLKKEQKTISDTLNQSFVQGEKNNLPVRAKQARQSPSVITAPSVGIFYAAKSPQDEPFVKVGDQVKEGDSICIIEVMKVLNEVKADKGGRVAKIFVENGESVEYGQKLIQLE